MNRSNRHSPLTPRRAPWLLLAVAVSLLPACGRRLQGSPPPAASHTAAPAASRPGAPAVSARAAPAASQAAPARRLPAGQADPPRLDLGTRGAVSSAEAHATDVGIRILERGGNAVDAAIAVQFALAVTHPAAGNIGGGGFMVVRLADGTAAAIDYRERAPGRASRDMYLDAQGRPTGESLRGPKAAGIPGTVAGMALAQRRFGTLPWAELLAPAVQLARDGHVLDSYHADDLRVGVDKMRAAGLDQATSGYLRPDGSYFRAGDTWRQPALAKTLQLISDAGPDGFYRTGPLPGQLAAAVAAAGGIWTAADLAGYQAVERRPVRFAYRGHEVITMPPPSGGGVVLRQILGASELLDIRRFPWRSAAAAHLYLEACRRAYADRNYLLGDPDFVKIPLAELLSPGYIRGRMRDIDAARATPSSQVRPGLQPPVEESEETTHFSVVDDRGNAVANTTTLNTSFGSLFVAGDTGVLLNNEMDDFAVKPGSANVFGLVQSEQNRIEPGKRMLSSMTPTILIDGRGQLRAIVGSPGGPTITTTVAQILRALVDYGRSLDEAVAAKRLHHQWLPDRIEAESGLDPILEAGLIRRGHKLHKRRRMGHANCIEIDPVTAGFRAVADVGRDGGKAAAY